MERLLAYRKASFTLPLLRLRQLGIVMLLVFSLGVDAPARVQTADADPSIEADEMVDLAELSVEELLEYQSDLSIAEGRHRRRSITPAVYRRTGNE